MYRGLEVPEVLLSGNHEQIAQWRYQQSLTKTSERRADLLESNYRRQHDGDPNTSHKKIDD
jgi:tRNA (guanine37-N1)-methyltransferase